MRDGLENLTPKWEEAPAEVRRAWHRLNGTHLKLVQAIERAQDALAEAQKVLEELPSQQADDRSRDN